jgi:type II secretory pathway component PulF
VPLYRYEALDRTGNKVVGAMQVTDEYALSTRLSAMGYQPTVIEIAQRNLTPASRLTPTGSPLVTAPANASTLTASERAVAQLFHQLHIAFRSGMPAIQAITTVSTQVHDRGLREALTEMGRGVQNGRTISELMEHYPRIFSRGDVGTIRAAEMGGFLPEAMALLGNQHEQDDNTQRKLRVWVWFFHGNVALIPFITAALFFFPALAASEFKVSEGLKAVGHAFLFISLPMIAVYVASLFGFQSLRKSPRFAERWHRLLLRLPIAGKINYLRANAVFTRTLQYLNRAGVDSRSAWETASGAVPNLCLAQRFASGLPTVHATGRFSTAMQETALLDPHDAGMVATGESAGEVAEALDYLAARYEGETQTALGASVVRGAVTSVTWVVILTGLLGVGFAYSYLRMATTVMDWIN